MKVILQLWLCAASLLLGTASVHAAGVTGFWALRAESLTLMVFQVERSRQGWTAVWTQPGAYDILGEYFNDIKNTVISRRACEVRVVPNGVDLLFDNPWPGAVPDHIVIRLDDETHADMRWAAFKSVPYRLTRISAPTRLGPWRYHRAYLPDTNRPTDAEMTAMFDADQAARKDMTKIDWRVVEPADRARRARTQELLDRGRLSSGDDFYHAAYVFQHGDKPDDFLKAHALATIAISRGRPDATWLAAATLDRYFQYSGQPQIYGMQFGRPATATKYTQEPYRRDLLSDALREASNVPPLAEQEQNRAEWDRRIPIRNPR